jgi:DMSO/TMAO reductase YedYZ molybdopterin-dependent catalytic subunit
MEMSRRETMQSATALAALSLAAIAPSATRAQNAGQPDKLVDTPLRNIATLPLKPDGSAVEYTQAEVGPIDGVLWKTKNQTPDIEFDYRKLKVKIDSRGAAKLSGTLTFSDLEKLPRSSMITMLQCGAPKPHGIVKWTGVKFSDFAQSVGAQSFANYVRFVGSDAYFLDEDMKTLSHPQVMLAWLMNDQPIPPQNGAPLRLVVPFRYGARSMKAITEIGFTATSFPPAKPWPT